MSQALFDAIEAGDAAKVNGLLAKDPSLKDAKTKEGIHAAVFALYHGRKGIADAILARNPTLDLHAAAAVGDLRRAQELVEEDPTAVHTVSPDGFPPMGLAAYMGHADIVEYLLSCGANVNQAGTNPGKFTALTGAASQGHYRAAKILVEAGADVNYWYSGGFTPVLEAAANGDLEMLELLVSHGGDVTAKTEQGKTAVSLAMEKGHPEAAEWLRKHGAK